MSVLVAHAGNTVSSGNVTTSSIDTTGANLIIVGINSTFGPTTNPVQDSKSNTWTLIGGGSGVTHNTDFSLYYCYNPTVGSGHTFTQLSNGSGFNQGIVVGAFSGAILVSSTVLDGARTIASGDPPTPAQAGSITPTQSNDIFISLGVTEQGSGVPTPNSGMIVTDSVEPPGLVFSYQFLATTSAINPLWTLGSGNLHWGVLNQAFFGTSNTVTITIPKGSLTTTTYAPAAITVINIAVPLATLALTTYAPAVVLFTNTSVPAGAVSITTFAPALVINLPVPTGTIVITGYAPSLATNIPVPVGALAIATYAPALTFGIAVPKGTLAFTTYAPQVQSVYIPVPVQALTLSTYVPTLSFNRLVEVPAASLILTTYAPVVFIGNIGPCDDRFGPKIYFWEPSYLIRPEDTFLRATDWDAAGYDGLKFVQGLIIEADTEGQTREIMIQGDQLDVETLTINHNGQLEKPYSLNQPVLKHLLRLLPTDLSAHWRLFNVRWVYEPAPEFAKEWKTQGTDHDIPGFQFLKDGYIAHASTADITFNVTVDDITFTYTIPNSGGQYVKTYLIFGIKPTGRTTKGTLFTYELTSSEPFQLYQKDCEVRVHDWKGGEFVVKQPFGDISRVYGARI